MDAACYSVGWPRKSRKNRVSHHDKHIADRLKDHHFRRDFQRQLKHVQEIYAREKERRIRHHYQNQPKHDSAEGEF